MEDEPLDEWAARREQQRPKRGERRAVPLGEQAEQGSHVDPDAPRCIQQWDGHEWIPVGVTEDHQTAATETGQDSGPRAERVSLPTFSKLPSAPTAPWHPTETWHRP